jgi:hypothetical protein
MPSILVTLATFQDERSALRDLQLWNALDKDVVPVMFGASLAVKSTLLHP